MDPFLHADQPQSAVSFCLFHIEADPLIFYFKQDFVGCLSQSYLELNRAAISHSIVQGFLRNPGQGETDILRQMGWYVFLLELDTDFMLFREFPAKAPIAAAMPRYSSFEECNW